MSSFLSTEAASVDLAFRATALRLGSWLAWISIGAVLAGVALNAEGDRWLLVGLAVAAASSTRS